MPRSRAAKAVDTIVDRPLRVNLPIRSVDNAPKVGVQMGPVVDKKR
jgi:hypothetical protein